MQGYVRSQVHQITLDFQIYTSLIMCEYIPELLKNKTLVYTLCSVSIQWNIQKHHEELKVYQIMCQLSWPTVGESHRLETHKVLSVNISPTLF